METPVQWSEIVSELDSEHQELLFGTSLSRRFSRLPLWLSHPANIGMFYGLLISLALIFPYILRYDNLNESFSNWLLFSALFMAACLVLGFSSLILVSLTKRLPMAPPRIILYPMPFIGIGLLGLDFSNILDIPSGVSLFVLLLPGPAYVHLSWAPRWRLLCMLDEGVNPFDDLKTYVEPRQDSADNLAGEDLELLEVVDAFESE
ncbi:MAG: hypothetical protein CMA41_05630 [Euryarchaeota archaeon]|jgi:hypothetical protein|nr:hypothetical protein [Euryarchaeota archaeon]|tara:strand:- start:1572 stop:2186 length:615 start_codon:yes stop_codon:yes gene_type:complete